MNELSATDHSTVTEDQIDALGHMNVHYYASAAERATQVMIEKLSPSGGLRLDVVDVYTRHHHEQLVGNALVVESGVVGAAAETVRLYHQLVNPSADQLAATFVHELASVGPDGGRVELPESRLEVARSTITTIPAAGGPRSIDLARDALALAPAIGVLRDREMAICFPWSLQADQCGDDDRLQPALTRSIPWMGEPVSDTVHQPIRTTEDGTALGMATMETRVSTAKRPHLGQRIETFGGLVDVGSKTLHSRQWSFDADTGEVLIAFETVLLAFDTNSRRSVAIPDSIRELERLRLHPDLVALTP